MRRAAVRFVPFTRATTLAVLLLAAAAAPAAAHPFDVHDLLAMQRLSDPQVSPDGRRVAFVVRTTDLEANRGRTDLWLLDLAADGTAAGEPRRLTSDPDSDSNPRWSPDGAWLYFLSGRSGSSQVWRLPLAGGEAAAGDRPAARRRQPGGGAGRRPPGLHPRRLPRLRRPRLHHREAGRARGERRHRPPLHRPAVPPLGRLGRRPPVAPVHARPRRGRRGRRAAACRWT